MHKPLTPHHSQPSYHTTSHPFYHTTSHPPSQNRYTSLQGHVLSQARQPLHFQPPWTPCLQPHQTQQGHCKLLFFFPPPTSSFHSTTIHYIFSFHHHPSIQPSFPEPIFHRQSILFQPFLPHPPFSTSFFSLHNHPSKSTINFRTPILPPPPPPGWQQGSAEW